MVAPYKFTGCAALSVERAITFLILFLNVLKFIHREKISWHGNKKKIIKNKELFSFWHRGKYYVSSYYFEKQLRLLNYKSKDFILF